MASRSCVFFFCEQENFYCYSSSGGGCGGGGGGGGGCTNSGVLCRPNKLVFAFLAKLAALFQTLLATVLRRLKIVSTKLQSAKKI